MKNLMSVIDITQMQFKNRLEALLSGSGLTEEQYFRYLSMQYHLTKGVQRHFFRIAGHADLSRRRSLRKFLVTFANEEELHYEVAFNDIKELGRTPVEKPLDVTLWWAYFESVIETQPFIRLGATCILENIAGQSQDVISALFSKATYMTKKNSRFFTIHRHDETLPHGDQILEAVRTADLNPEQMADLVRGAEIASILYLRMVDWALDTVPRADQNKFTQGHFNPEVQVPVARKSVQA